MLKGLSHKRSHALRKLWAKSPTQVVLHFLKVFEASLRRSFDHDAFGTAKAAAYSSIITFFPALLVLGSILASSRQLELYVPEISDALDRILPIGTGTAVQYLRNTRAHPIDFLIATSLLTIWTASSAIVSWMEGFRRAYQLPPTWGVAKERLIACSLVILAGIPLAFATVLIAFGRQIEMHIVMNMNHSLGPYVLLLWTGIRWLIASLTSIAVIALIYHNAVPRTRPWHTVIPGAVLASGLWFVSTWLFGWYLGRSTEYSIIYGFLAVGIALLVWMYVVSLTVLIGAEFNAILFPRTVASGGAPVELRIAGAA
jgi:membrane protein